MIFSCLIKILKKSFQRKDTVDHWKCILHFKRYLIRNMFKLNIMGTFMAIAVGEDSRLHAFMIEVVSDMAIWSTAWKLFI